MADIIPKLTDVSGLKAASTLLALPMLCVAYVLQDGAQVGFDGHVWLSIPSDLDQTFQLRRLLFIFVLKALWVAFWGMIGYGVLAWAHFTSNFPLLQTASVVLLSVGIFGIFGQKTYPQLDAMSNYWFYCSIVWALFLGSMAEQIDKATEHLDGA